MSAGAESDASSSSTEYVPIADRGRPRPLDLVDEIVQPNQAAKKRKRLERERAAKLVEDLGRRVLARFGMAAVELIWAASAPIDPGAAASGEPVMPSDNGVRDAAGASSPTISARTPEPEKRARRGRT